MAKEYIDISQLWKCETCFHHQTGSCYPSIWCDHGESYRPAYDKLKKADVAEVKHGRWTLHYDGSGTCDQCHFTQKAVWDYDNWQNYCGVCGADMRERKDGDA